MMKLTLVVLLSMSALALGEQEKRLLGSLTGILGGGNGNGSGGLCIDVLSLLETLGYNSLEAFAAEADTNGDGVVSNAEAAFLVTRLNAQGRGRGNGNAGAGASFGANGSVSAGAGTGGR